MASRTRASPAVHIPASSATGGREVGVRARAGDALGEDGGGGEPQRVPEGRRAERHAGTKRGEMGSHQSRRPERQPVPRSGQRHRRGDGSRGQPHHGAQLTPERGEPRLERGSDRRRCRRAGAAAELLVAGRGEAGRGSGDALEHRVEAGPARVPRTVQHRRDLSEHVGRSIERAGKMRRPRRLARREPSELAGERLEGHELDAQSPTLVHEAQQPPSVGPAQQDRCPDQLFRPVQRQPGAQGPACGTGPGHLGEAGVGVGGGASLEGEGGRPPRDQDEDEDDLDGATGGDRGGDLTRARGVLGKPPEEDECHRRLDADRRTAIADIADGDEQATAEGPQCEDREVEPLLTGGHRDDKRGERGAAGRDEHRTDGSRRGRLRRTGATREGRRRSQPRLAVPDDWERRRRDDESQGDTQGRARREACRVEPHRACHCPGDRAPTSGGCEGSTVRHHHILPRPVGGRPSLAEAGGRPCCCRAALDYPELPEWQATPKGPARDPVTRGCSSAGRAPRSQRGSRRFESAHLHQEVFTFW